MPLGEAFIGDGPDTIEWEPGACDALDGHANDTAWEGPETIALGYSRSLHDTTFPTRNNEE